jgi:hypothetical protein
MYYGTYNGKAYHLPDLPAALRRSYAAGVERIIITAGSLAEAKAALDLARTDGISPDVPWISCHGFNSIMHNRCKMPLLF